LSIGGFGGRVELGIVILTILLILIHPPVIVEIIINPWEQFVNFLLIRPLIPLPKNNAYSILLYGLVEELYHFRDRVERVGVDIVEDLLGLMHKLLCVFFGNMIDDIFGQFYKFFFQFHGNLSVFANERVEFQNQFLVVFDHFFGLIPPRNL
jgi:hypothetical protein